MVAEVRLRSFFGSRRRFTFGLPAQLLFRRASRAPFLLLAGAVLFCLMSGFSLTCEAHAAATYSRSRFISCRPTVPCRLRVLLHMAGPAPQPIDRKAPSCCTRNKPSATARIAAEGVHQWMTRWWAGIGVCSRVRAEGR
eukprot:scaffold59_cov119-Isochrysis_galbana.AAC.3